MGISICISSQDPNVAHLTVRYNLANEAYSHLIKLGFNAHKTIAYYRIDWYPDKVDFYIRKKLRATVFSNKFMIPDKPMHIRIGIIPQLVGEVHRSPEDSIFLMMLCFQVRYDKLNVIHDYTELFMLSPDLSRPHSVSLLFIPFLLMCTAALFNFLWKEYYHIEEKSCELNGYYMSLDT